MIPIKDNGSIHDCDICVHKKYCRKTAKSLRDNHAEKRFEFEHGKPIIFIPENCPIITKEKMKVKVVLI